MKKDEFRWIKSSKDDKLGFSHDLSFGILLHCEDLLTPFDPQPVRKDLITLTLHRRVHRDRLTVAIAK